MMKTTFASGLWMSCVFLLSLAGCKSHRSGTTSTVEPKHSETLSELAVPADFDFALARTVRVEVELTAGNPGVVIVQEPNRFGYDPFSALSKGVVSAGNPFDPSIRVSVDATRIPVLLYRDGTFEESTAAIDIDGTARVVFP